MNPKLKPILFRSLVRYRSSVNTYNAITSLDAYAKVAQMKAGLSGMTVTNLVSNGDFSDGTTGWLVYNSGILSVSGGILTIAYTSTTGAYVDILGAGIWFVYGSVANINATNIRIRTTDYGGLSTALDSNVVTGTSYEKASVLTDAKATGVRIYLRMENSGSAKVDWVTAINLTAIGLQAITDVPTLTAMFPYYFSGTVHAGATRFTSKDKDDNIVSVSYTPHNIVLRRLPNGTRDTIEQKSDGTWKKVQRVSDGVAVVGVVAVNTINYPLSQTGGSFINVLTAGGTETGIIGTNSTSADGTLYYELLTPVETYHTATPTLYSQPNGTVIAEPWDVDLIDTSTVAIPEKTYEYM